MEERDQRVQEVKDFLANVQAMTDNPRAIMTMGLFSD
jgi:hypothetical protein